MANEALIDILLEYSRDGRLPMHMPGHKRSDAFEYLRPLGAGIDITEIDGFDDLNSPEEIFLRSEEMAARLWGSDFCLFSVNGSSGAILAGIRAALRCKTGRKVVLTRTSHKSVYHAIEICGASPEYLRQDTCRHGFAVSVSPNDVKKSLDENPDTSLVIVTSPTYEGVISDIRSIASICHSYGIPLLVDEAHGAHLGLYGAFPEGAVACGADIVVQSIHKTLPSLTQTALLHISGDLVDHVEVRRQMAVFQTSSPSYVLSASIDGAVRFLSSPDGKASIYAWHNAVCELRERLVGLKHLILFRNDDGVFAYDPSKLVICGAGVSLAEYLRVEKSIEPEMTAESYVIAMTGAGDTVSTLERFGDAVLEADLASLETSESVSAGGIYLPRQAVSPTVAVGMCREACHLDSAEGKTSAGYVYAYPPGIPLVVPGEVIDSEVIRQIRGLERAGISLRGVRDGIIHVCRE